MIELLFILVDLKLESGWAGIASDHTRLGSSWGQDDLIVTGFSAAPATQSLLFTTNNGDGGGHLFILCVFTSYVAYCCWSHSIPIQHERRRRWFSHYATTFASTTILKNLSSDFAVSTKKRIKCNTALNLVCALSHGTKKSLYPGDSFKLKCASSELGGIRDKREVARTSHEKGGR